MENKINKSILKNNVFKQIENDLKENGISYPYCIGIDGATATGKTVLANLLKEHLKKKLKIDSEIFQLDFLLLNRKFREKEVIEIKKNNINFSYEAENHMRFQKINKLISKILDIKKSEDKKSKILINNLYSRENNGTCCKTKVIDLSKKVIIFEGHYTSRNFISAILDKNIILFSDRNNILKRKINRSQSYRNSNDVIKYFDHIDLPSIKNNFLRFYNPKFCLIDNNNFKKPKILNYNGAFKILNIKKNKTYINNKKKLEYIFGYKDSKKKIFLLIKKIIKKTTLNNRIIESYLNRLNIKNKHYYIYNKDNSEKDFIHIIYEDNKKYYLVQNKNNPKEFILSFENGIFLIDEKNIFNLGISHNNSLKIISSIKIQNKVIKNSNLSIFNHLFKLKNSSRKFCYLSLLNSNYDKFFLYDFFQNSGWQIKFLDDFYFLAPNYVDNKLLKKNKSIINLSYLCDLNYTKKLNYEKKEILYSSNNFFINADYCEIKKKINSKNFFELEKLILSKNYQIRRNTYKALLNYKFSSKLKIKRLIKNYLPFYPTYFSRLYSINKILNMQVGILANNIYDLSEKSADIFSYLDTSNSNKIPFVLQSSLNAIGHEEKNNNKRYIGYLNAKNGPKSFIKSISKTIMYLGNKKRLNNLFYGIGLDHIDINGDKPKGRSKRFLSKSLDTKSVTHLTLDSSALFKINNTKLENLNKIYKKIFRHSNLLTQGLNFVNCDLEFCTGELNYISKKKIAHYPIKREVAMFDRIYNSTIDELYKKNTTLNLLLKNKVKLYVGNLGTTHHGNDRHKDLKINLSEEWNQANEQKNFISPVLHGTTNSKNFLFKKASKHCLKINIAGSYLKTLFSNLDNETKKLFEFKKFDKNTKYLAYNLKDLSFNKKEKSISRLKKQFKKYSYFNNYENLKIKDLNQLRKSTYYLEDVSRKFLLELKKILSI